jgi:hypothetical protein
MNGREGSGNRRPGRPEPREPGAPWWVALRSRTRAFLAATVTAVPAAIWVGSGSVEDVGAVVLIMLASTALPEVREALAEQAWRVVLERRLRQAFLELPVVNGRGLTPTILRSAARGGSVIVRVWLPVGLTLEAVERARLRIAELCFVDEVLVGGREGSRNTAEIVLVRRTLGRRT